LILQEQIKDIIIIVMFLPKRLPSLGQYPQLSCPLSRQQAGRHQDINATKTWAVGKDVVSCCSRRTRGIRLELSRPVAEPDSPGHGDRQSRRVTVTES